MLSLWHIVKPARGRAGTSQGHACGSGLTGGLSLHMSHSGALEVLAKRETVACLRSPQKEWEHQGGRLCMSAVLLLLGICGGCWMVFTSCSPAGRRVIPPHSCCSCLLCPRLPVARSRGRTHKQHTTLKHDV